MLRLIGGLQTPKKDLVLLYFDFLSLRFMLDNDFGSVALISSTEETNTIAYSYYKSVSSDLLIDLRIPL
jgi:hypothetical protein